MDNSGYSWRKFFAVTCLFSLVLLSAFAFAQETTGGIQGTVKDPQGAVISGATVEVTSSALIGSKKATTDSGGYFRFANLPPGTYDVSVTASGFGNSKQTGLALVVGALPTINFSLKVGGTSEVVEVTGEEQQIDVAHSKVQSNVTEQIIDAIPKGRSYQSLITFAPGARLEPLQDQRFGQGYQIDGASSSENSYLVEGQETSGIVRGEGIQVPIEFIKEVQIKSSGFEAEYGGALGGVVNVIQQRGSNKWHGSVFMYYQGDKFNAAPSKALRNNPLQTTVGRIAESPEFYQPKKDHRRIVDPGFEVGGPVFKDKLWAFVSFAPQISSLRRVNNYNCTTGALCSVSPFVNTRATTQNYVTYNGFARLDGQLWNRVRLFGSFQTQYQRANGTSLPAADSAYGQVNPGIGTGTHPDQFNYGIGTVAPNVLYNTGADITITPALVATTRFGYFFTDLQSRGLPVGIRYVQQNSTSAATLDRNGVPLPANLVVSAGSANIGANLQQQFDKTSRRSFSQDLAFFKRTSFGTHNFKFGYAYNKIAENLLVGFKDSQVLVSAGGLNYSPVTAPGQAACAAIVLASGPTYGTATACAGRYGFFIVRQGVETKGKVGSDNQALYFQDGWTVGHGVTINAGIRFDREFLPSFKAGAQEIRFGFGSKVAPRIGASWDVLQNGKLKVYGSYGKFFDIMKYELPQGSFGGQYWHDCAYAMDNPAYTGILPTRDAAGNFCPLTGQANGVIPAGNRFIENNDLRIPANDPSDSRIVPGIKPMEQHEFVFGADYSITKNILFESRYSRKRLDRTIEDIGALTPAGEAFFIGNPGVGAIGDQSGICPACKRQPVAVREYDGLEFRLTKRASAKWFGTVSYTWSRLFGNYSGLSSTDETGRVDPNVSRMFDEPQYQFDSHGKYAMGPLATDRPHTVSAFGYYRMKWWGMETLVGATQSWFSGTPITTALVSVGATPQLVENRGKFANVTRDAAGVWTLNGVSSKRTPMFSQTDFNFVHEVKVSKSNEAMRVAFEANMFNLFNEKNILNYNANLLRTNSVCPGAGGCTTPDWNAIMNTGYDYVAAANAQGRVLNGLYGQPSLFQTGRAMRFKLRFTF